MTVLCSSQYQNRPVFAEDFLSFVIEVMPGQVRQSMIWIMDVIMDLITMVCGGCPDQGTVCMGSSTKSYLTPHSLNFGSGGCCLLINSHDFFDIAEWN
jgi:hypothetical protein